MQKKVVGQASRIYSTWWVLKMGVGWMRDGVHEEVRKEVSLDR